MKCGSSIVKEGCRVEQVRAATRGQRAIALAEALLPCALCQHSTLHYAGASTVAYVDQNEKRESYDP